MASTNKSILDVFERNKYNLEEVSQKSRGWFDQEARKLRRQNPIPQRIIKGDPSNMVGKVFPGRMYMFMYDAKGAEILPYFDQFPLVIPWRRTGDGFIGLNIHYLPYFYRVQLLDRLMLFRTNKKMDETTRLRYSWKLIDGVARYRAAKPCVKQYLYGQVASKFRLIPIENWATAALLPVERFSGATKQRVWMESVKRMRT